MARRSTYIPYSSRVVPLPSIPENEFLIAPGHEAVELGNQSSMNYSRIDSSPLPEWESSECDEPPRSRWTMVCRIMRWPFYMLLGMITVQQLSRLHGIVSSLVYQKAVMWSSSRHRPSLFSSWFTHGINPVPCHSHNDYWRPVPLYSALMA